MNTDRHLVWQPTWYVSQCMRNRSSTDLLKMKWTLWSSGTEILYIKAYHFIFSNHTYICKLTLDN